MNFIFPIILGISSSQLTLSPSFFRGVGGSTSNKVDSSSHIRTHKDLIAIQDGTAVDVGAKLLAIRGMANIPMAEWPRDHC